MLGNKRKIILKAKERGHLMAAFRKSQYGGSIYEISTCKYCDKKIFLRDGEVESGSALDADCNGKSGDNDV